MGGNTNQISLNFEKGYSCSTFVTGHVILKASWLKHMKIEHTNFIIFKKNQNYLDSLLLLLRGLSLFLTFVK